MAARTSRCTIEPIAPNAWVAVGNRDRGVPTNAGIVDLGSAVLVVDTFPTPQAAGELRAAARLVTGRDPGAVVNTGWRFDHWLGNRAFVDCEIYSTVETRERILETGPSVIEAVSGDAGREQQASIDRRLELEQRPLYRDELAMEAAARRELYEMYRSLEVVAPNLTFATRRLIPALKSAWLVEVSTAIGRGTMVFLTDAEVLFTGDVVTSSEHPPLVPGSLDGWSKGLDGVEKISPKILVPGRGPVGGPELAEPMREYLAILRAGEGPEDPDALPEPFSGWRSPSQYRLNRSAVAPPG